MGVFALPKLIYVPLPEEFVSLEEATRPIAERWADIVQHVKNEYLSPTQAYPWIVGFSGGKDSTVVAHAVFEALLAIPPSLRTRPVHIVSNDTMVESPPSNGASGRCVGLNKQGRGQLGLAAYSRTHEAGPR